MRGLQLLQARPDALRHGGALDAIDHVALHGDGEVAAFAPQHARLPSRSRCWAICVSGTERPLLVGK